MQLKVTKKASEKVLTSIFVVLYINVTVAFGGVEIKVPDNVQVVNNIPCIFGGTDVMKNNPGAEHTIYIDGFCAFGGIDIK